MQYTLYSIYFYAQTQYTEYSIQLHSAASTPGGDQWKAKSKILEILDSNIN